MVHDFLHLFCDIGLEMAPWLLAGFGLAFLCSFFLSERWIRRHLGGPGWLPILKASVVGLPLPVCSCGVLLVALALRRSGARKAPVCAFLASTPMDMRLSKLWELVMDRSCGPWGRRVGHD